MIGYAVASSGELSRVRVNMLVVEWHCCFEYKNTSACNCILSTLFIMSIIQCHCHSLSHQWQLFVHLCFSYDFNPLLLRITFLHWSDISLLTFDVLQFTIFLNVSIVSIISHSCLQATISTVNVVGHFKVFCESFLFFYVYSLLLRPGRGAEYCNQFVCLSVCLSVCLQA